MGELIDKTKGKIKQAVGILNDDKKLEREGKVDEASGKAKGAVDKASEKVKGAVESAKHAVKDALKK